MSGGDFVLDSFNAYIAIDLCIKLQEKNMSLVIKVTLT